MRLEMEWPPTTRTTNWKGGRKREEECRRSRGISAFLASGSYLPLRTVAHADRATEAALPYKLVTKSFRSELIQILAEGPTLDVRALNMYCGIRTNTVNVD